MLGPGPAQESRKSAILDPDTLRSLQHGKSVILDVGETDICDVGPASPGNLRFYLSIGSHPELRLWARESRNSMILDLRALEGSGSPGNIRF